MATLATIIKDKDLRDYAGDAFWNLIKAIFMEDTEAVIVAGDNIKNMLFHTPTLIFWDKMKRYLCGTFRDYEEQVKMASKFNEDNDRYVEFVKRQMHLINEIDDDKKVDYFAMLTRCFLLTDLEEALFYKLAKYIDICTPYELDFMKSISYEYESDNNAMISSLYQYGLFLQGEKDGKTVYVLSDFGKALKNNSLNFNDDVRGMERLTSYERLEPLNIAEPIPAESIKNLFK